MFTLTMATIATFVSCDRLNLLSVSFEERCSALTELKTNIQTKTKSLKRRRGESQFSATTTKLKDGLNNLTDELSIYIDLTKRLMQCQASEGKSLFDAVAAVPGLTVGQEVWKRRMKAWCFEAGTFV